MIWRPIYGLAAAAIACAAAGLAGYWHGHGVARTAGQLELSLAREAANAAAMRHMQEVRSIEAAWADRLSAAQQEASRRENEIRTALARVERQSRGLRDDLAAANLRVSEAAASAVAEYARTAGELLGQCTERYLRMAEAAQRHADDVRVMRDAWPR